MINRERQGYRSADALVFCRNNFVKALAIMAKKVYNIFVCQFSNLKLVSPKNILEE